MREIIAESLKLSDQQYNFASNADWEKFHRFEPKRQQLIHSLGNVGIDIVSPDEIRSDLEKLIALNDQIGRLCIDQRNALMQMLVDIRTGAKVSNAYEK